MDDAHILSAQVTRMTDTVAELSLNGQLIRWPLSAMPAGVKAGDTVNLRLLSEYESTLERHERARAILAEILGGQS